MKIEDRKFYYEIDIPQYYESSTGFKRSKVRWIIASNMGFYSVWDALEIHG